MASKNKETALGSLLIAGSDIEKTRGGKQKLQKVLGVKNFYQQGKSWFYNTPVLKTFSVEKLDALTAKIKALK